VIRTLEKALDKLDQDLAELGQDELLQLLDEDQLERAIHFKSDFLRPIGSIISLIENADVTAVPGELTAPLRREVRRLFPDAEVLMVANPELNYTIVELAGYIRELLSQLGVSDRDVLPHQIFRISIPKIEYDQVLLHCVLAHELGHPLYRELKLEDKILPISLDEARIVEIYNQLRTSWERKSPGSSQTEMFSELFFKNVVTKEVNNVIPNWIEEIAADLLGLLILGPAYVLASIHFSSSVFLLNSASPTHPPQRFRLKVLFRFMKKHFPFEQLQTRTREVLNSWDNIARRDIAGLKLFEQIAYDTIDDDSVFQRLTQAVLENLPDSKRFSIEYYRREVDAQTELINAIVPPVEYLHDGRTTLSSVSGILNSGWECDLQGLDEFKENLPDQEPLTEFDVKFKFNKFLIKSIEQNQIAHEWGEISDAIGRRSD
jgi:hypothetical protein